MNKENLISRSVKKVTGTEPGLIVLMSVFFLAGFIFHQFTFTRGMVMSLTDIFLFLSNGLVFFFLFRNNQDRKLIYWSILVFITTFLIEFAGTRSGKIFGAYSYGETMVFKLLDVPVIIAVNWTVLILSTYSLAKRWIHSRLVTPILSSVLIILFDFVMEPVAMHLDYWQWEGGEIPYQNYLAWFIISLFFAGLLSFFKINPDSKILRYFFFIQLIFFLLFRIFSMHA